MRRNPAIVAFILAAAMPLTGCGWFGGKEAKVVCPASFVAPDADKVAVFRPGGSTANDVSYGVLVNSVQSKCNRADQGLTVSTNVEFRLVTKDPALRNGRFEYFVSVIDGNHEILTKRTYSVPFEFGPRLHDITKKDELIENLPLRDPATGGSYAVVVGLQLTEAQLRFNRSANRIPSVSVAPSESVALPPQPRNSASP